MCYTSFCTYSRNCKQFVQCFLQAPSHHSKYPVCSLNCPSKFPLTKQCLPFDCHTIQCLPSNSHTMQCDSPQCLSSDSHTIQTICTCPLISILLDFWFPCCTICGIPEHRAEFLSPLQAPCTLYKTQQAYVHGTLLRHVTAQRLHVPTGSKLVLGFLTIRGDCCAGITLRTSTLSVITCGRHCAYVALTG